MNKTIQKLNTHTRRHITQTISHHMHAHAASVRINRWQLLATSSTEPSGGAQQSSQFIQRARCTFAKHFSIPVSVEENPFAAEHSWLLSASDRKPHHQHRHQRQQPSTTQNRHSVGNCRRRDRRPFYFGARRFCSSVLRTTSIVK